MKDELYYGLARISKRLGVGRDIARKWCEAKRIRAHKDGSSKTAPWYCVESELNEDIKTLPGRLQDGGK